MILVWREEARADLRDITAFVAGHNPAAAIDLNLRISECAERLVEHPFMFRTGRVPGTREALVHPNYVLIYRVTADAVEIVNVMHSRRRYPAPDAG